MIKRTKLNKKILILVLGSLLALAVLGGVLSRKNSIPTDAYQAKIIGISDATPLDGSKSYQLDNGKSVTTIGGWGIEYMKETPGLKVGDNVLVKENGYIYKR